VSEATRRLGVGVTVILKWIVTENYRRVWTGFTFSAPQSSGSRSKTKKKPTQHSTCSLLPSCLVYPRTLNNEVTRSSETSVDSQRTRPFHLARSCEHGSEILVP
jgi:hypothetical protein